MSIYIPYVIGSAGLMLGNYLYNYIYEDNKLVIESTPSLTPNSFYPLPANKVISSPRDEMSEHAPRIITFRIPTDKIRDVIGKGGATIRQITEETGATVDIDDDGTIKIASVDNAAGQAARTRVEAITADIEVGTVYEGKVQKLMDFGAFVNILPGKDGLVHISQISEERVENVSDKLSEGDTVKVKVLEVDKQGRIRLSMKAV